MNGGGTTSFVRVERQCPRASSTASRWAALGLLAVTVAMLWGCGGKQKEVDSLKKEVDSLKGQCNALKGQVGSKSAEIARLTAEVTAKEQSIRDKNVEIEHLKGQIEVARTSTVAVSDLLNRRDQSFNFERWTYLILLIGLGACLLYVTLRYSALRQQVLSSAAAGALAPKGVEHA